MSKEPQASPFWPADNPAVTGHMTILQNIITRLANNSASCKTWCLTLVAALLSIAGTAHAPSVVTAALVPVIIFGFLDIMYLASEVAYRNLYNGLVDKLHGRSYGLDDVFRAGARPDAGCVIWAMGSWSICPYYGLLLFYGAAEYQGWTALLAHP